MKTALAFILALACLPALAQQPRTIDFTQNLKGFDDQPLTLGADKQTATLGDVASVD